MFQQVVAKLDQLLTYQSLAAEGIPDPGLDLVLLEGRANFRPVIFWLQADIDSLTTGPRIEVLFGSDSIAIITSGILVLGGSDSQAEITYPGILIGNSGEALTVNVRSTTGTGIVRATVGYIADSLGGTSVFNV